MQLRRIHRRLALIACGLGTAGLMLTAPVRAQEPTQTGGRMRILIPTLEHPKGVDDGFGKTVAEAMRKAIDKLPTHTAISKDEIRDNLRKYKIDEKDLDCVKARQLAVQIGSELVMCGNYAPAAGGQYAVSASFIGAKSGETFEVPQFNAAKPEDAATQIYGAFEKYVNQLRALAICQQYLGSQQYPSAITNCNAALAINPQSATALYYKGQALMNMGADSMGAALAAMRQVIQLNPTNGEALRAAGVIAAKMDSSALSTQYFHQYLEMNPGAASVRLSLAGDAAKAGNPEGALAMVEEGFKADTAAANNPDLLLFAGHWALQASTKAADAARKAGEDKAPRADSLALVAAGYYNRLVALRDTAADPTVVRNLILIMASHNQAAQGVQMGAKFTQVHHNDAGIWSAYADALQANGQYQQALAALDTAAVYDTKGDFPVMAKRGQWLAERGNVSGAKAALQQAVQRGKISADDAAGLLLGIALRDKMGKDNAAAIEYLNAGRDLAESASNKGMAEYYIGTILFQRANAAGQGAKTQPARVRVAGMYKEAAVHLNAADAFVARNPRVRSAQQQMLDYVQTYTKAVQAAEGTTKVRAPSK